MKLSILSGLLSLCLNLSSFAQPKKALTIGDTLPMLVFSKMYNTTSPDSIQRNANTKPLLLDFWGTSCSNCIALFPKMNHLQTRFSNQLQILLINSLKTDTEAKVLAVFKKRYDRTGDRLEIPYILQDTVLVKKFPYQTIPQYVWINKNRVVVAITDQFAVTEENLQDFVSNKKINLPLKDDSKLFEPAAGELLNDSSSGNHEVIFQSAFIKANPVLGAIISFSNPPGFNGSTYTALNLTIPEFYATAYKKIFNLPYGYVVISDAAKEVVYLNDSTLKRVSYYLQTPVTSQEEQCTYLTEDLDRSFHLNVRNEMRMTPVWVLSSLPKKISKIKADDGPTNVENRENSLRKFIHNGTMKDFTDFVISLKNQYCLNETNINYKINLEIPTNVYNYTEKELNTWLASLGFKLEKKKRLMKFAVIDKR